MELKFYDVYNNAQMLVSCAIAAYCEEGAIHFSTKGEDIDTTGWKAFEIPCFEPYDE